MFPVNSDPLGTQYIEMYKTACERSKINSWNANKFVLCKKRIANCFRKNFDTDVHWTFIRGLQRIRPFTRLHKKRKKNL